jgi:hypothetical protein
LKLQRVISKYLTDNVSGLHAFKDEIAFVAAGNPYPYFLIDLISTRKRNLGTGLWDRTETTEDSATQVKVTKHHQVLRFTIRAVNGQEQNGNVIVTEVTDQIDNLLSDLCREGSVDLVDPVSGDSLHIEQTIFQSQSDLAPLEKRIPFVYQQSLSYLFVEHRFKTRVVENRIDQLNIEI